METDSLFYRLFQQLPETLFELLGLPATQAKRYRFESVELKKAFRVDGLFVPKKAHLPIYFVEVQFQCVANFYANLFAKVFCYLEENDPNHDWIAVAIFPSRAEEPADSGVYDDLLSSHRVKRIYLEELVRADDPPIGIGLVQLLFASMVNAQTLAPRLVRKVQADLADSDLQAKVVELLERLLLARFPEFSRQEMLMKFKLHDIRESKVWQEAHNLGVEEGIEKGRAEGIGKGKAERDRELVRSLLAKGKSQKEIAGLLNLSAAEVRKLANH